MRNCGTSPTEIQFRAGGSETGGPTNFTLDLYLEAEPGTGVLQLTATMGPGIQIAANLAGMTTQWEPGSISLPLFE